MYIKIVELFNKTHKKYPLGGLISYTFKYKHKVGAYHILVQTTY